MKTLAIKQPINDSSKQKYFRKKTQLNLRSRSISPLSPGMPLLQRKCACGGGCPGCQENLGIQTKLKIGEPGDKYEKEADRVADEVMRMPEPSIQRQIEPEEEEEEEMVQRKANTNSIFSVNQRKSDIPPIVHEVVRSPGQPLDSQTRLFMESRLGKDFSQVRVHTDPTAIASARMLNAKAYTLGQKVVFSEGQYTPETSPGKRLLAHELVHTVQQTRQSVPHTLQREDNPEASGKATQPKQDTDTAKVVKQGIDIVIDNLNSKNPNFKKEVTTPITEEVKNKWQSLSPTEKGVLSGFGAVSLGTIGASFAADEQNRKRVVDLIDGKNLIVPPLSWIPQMPVSRFKFKRSAAGTKDDNTLDLSFTVTLTPFLESLRKKHPKVPPLEASFDLEFTYRPLPKLEFNNDKVSKRVFNRLSNTWEMWQPRIGTFKLTIYGGIGISLSPGKISLPPPLPEGTSTPGGRFAISQAPLPKTEPATVPGFQVMINVDLAKIQNLPRKLDNILKVFR